MPRYLLISIDCSFVIVLANQPRVTIYFREYRKELVPFIFPGLFNSKYSVVPLPMINRKDILETLSFFIFLLYLIFIFSVENKATIAYARRRSKREYLSNDTSRICT